MKHLFKLGLSAVMATTLMACSNPEAHRQASDGFQYLDTRLLKNWRALPDQQVEFSGAYQIPAAKAYNGLLGSDVDIRPPQQVFELLPGMRYQRHENSVLVWMPQQDDGKLLGETIESLVADGLLPIRAMEAKGVETDWLKWSGKDDDETVETRHYINPIKDKMRSGFRVNILEIKYGGVPVELTPTLRDRYNTKMTNVLSTRFDDELRKEARLQALKRVKNIPTSMGTDRSGLPVIIARAPYDVFWERFPAMLNKLGLTIDERNNSQGTLNLRYSAPDDELWRALKIKPLPLSRKKYHVQLGDLGNRTSINLTDTSGKPVDEEVLKRFSIQLAAVINYLNKPAIKPK